MLGCRRVHRKSLNENLLHKASNCTHKAESCSKTNPRRGLDRLSFQGLLMPKLRGVGVTTVTHQDYRPSVLEETREIKTVSV